MGHANLVLLRPMCVYTVPLLMDTRYLPVGAHILATGKSI